MILRTLHFAYTTALPILDKSGKETTKATENIVSLIVVGFLLWKVSQAL
jgi:hypothetical protein